MQVDLHNLTCSRSARAVADGEISARELTDAALATIEHCDPEIGAFLEVFAERARRRADEIDASAEARQAPLAGVPIALKDNLCLEGQKTTAGSRILAPFVAPYTATAVARLEEAGAIVIGRTNLDEFAMGSSTENSAYQRTVNPHDPQRVPGGSSGGSAAAVASGQVLGALGSDTGGSIRQPASFCGLVGLKPTYGRVSRYGLIAFASSLDQVGPMGRTVEDVALLLGTIAGLDLNDSTTVDMPVPDYGRLLYENPRSLRIGVPDDWMSSGLSSEVRTAIEKVLADLEAIGVRMETIELPHDQYAIATYYVIATAEASSNLARYDGVRYGLRAEEPRDLTDMYARTRSEGFGPEVKRRILLGTFVLSEGLYEAYYGRAQRVRTLMRRDFAHAFARVDAIVGPTSPTTAFRHGERVDDPLAMYLSDVYTVTANLAGLPAVSVPCGRDTDGLPIGLQIIGRPFDEAGILKVARLVEDLSTGQEARTTLGRCGQ
jgi:aspartyl-tRNA(Asn)/glutamyl-tRNA(Gln) amidotransferase subunit A